MTRRVTSFLAIVANIVIRTRLTLPPDSTQRRRPTAITLHTVVYIELCMHAVVEHGRLGIEAEAGDIRAVKVARDVRSHIGSEIRLARTAAAVAGTTVATAVATAAVAATVVA